MKLLEEEIGIKWLGKAKNISLAFVAMIVASILMFAFLSMFFPGMPILREHDHNQITARALLFVCVIAPLWEELVFRHVPIRIAKSVPGGYGNLLLPIVLGSSVIFGLVHGGPPNILFQGVGGFLMAIVYIRNGYDYWSAVILHSTWNLFVFLYC